MNVYWTETALSHLDTIHAYIGRDSKYYAKRTVDRLTKRSVQIAGFPLSGRKVPEMANDRIREVIEGPYRIVYYLKPGRIEILAVIHGAEKFPWSK